MSEFLYILFIWVFGFIAGWMGREKHAINQVRKMRESGLVPEVVTAEYLEQQDFIPIMIEHDKGMFFVYNIKDKSFMAQGKTKQELEKNLAKNFPDKQFAALPQNLKEVGFDNDTI
jgi:hypothetical protein